ncbi:MAG: S8 family serine peptidase, partial [Anaerolineales bacterium]
MDRLKRSFLVLLILTTLLIPGFMAMAMQQDPRNEESRFIRMPHYMVGEIDRLEIKPKLILDYGAFYWMDLAESDWVKFSMAQQDNIVEIPNAGEVSVMDFRFDPVAKGEPDLPVEMRADEGRTGFRLFQFVGPIKDEWLENLRITGMELLQYYPQNTYLVWASPVQTRYANTNSAVRWTGLFHPAYRVSPSLRHAEGLIENVAVTIYDDGNISETLAQIESLGGKYIQHYPAQSDKRFYTAVFILDADTLTDIARINNVWAVEFISPHPAFDDEVGAQIVAGNYSGGTPLTGYYSWLTEKGVDGSGIIWADVDTGLNATHPDITGRTVAYVTYPGAPAADTDPDGHGSHTAGAIFGDGLNGTGIQDPNGFYWGTGAAPDVSLVVQNALYASTWPPPGGWEVMSKDSLINGAIGSNNSWYTGASGSQGYSSVARTHDLMVRDGNFDTTTVSEPIIMVFSAGNSGYDCSVPPCYSSITEPKEAKNIIVVGASDNYPRAGSSISDISFFSSRGPAQDGRILPNVMAPGNQTASFNGSSVNCGATVTGSGASYYNYCSGTSMAAPLVSGAAALIADWWSQEGWGIPSPAMVKALLINGSVDMSGGDDGWGNINSSVPNMDQGWGLVNMNNVIRTGLPSLYIDQETIFKNTGEFLVFSVQPENPALPIKISLVWSDAAGAIGANPALVNDLDLRVENDSLILRGNQFSGGWSVPGGTPDLLNNIENVYIQNPSGAYSVWIEAVAINGDGVPYNGDFTDQDFALVCYNCAEQPDFILTANPIDQSVCAPQNVYYDVEVNQILGFSDPVTLSTTGEPAGVSVEFDINPGIPPFSSTLTISNTDTAQAGVYDIDIIGIAPTTTHTTTVNMNLFDMVPWLPELVTPSDGAINQGIRPTFNWNPVIQVETYDLEISTDNAFSDIVFSTSQLAKNTYTLEFDLQTSTQYFWRVRAHNICGASNYSITYSFTTEPAPGDCPIGTSAPSILFSDDFESGAIGWTHGGTSDTWDLSSDRAHSGSQAYHARNVEWVSDQWLESPA